MSHLWRIGADSYSSILQLGYATRKGIGSGNRRRKKTRKREATWNSIMKIPTWQRELGRTRGDEIWTRSTIPNLHCVGLSKGNSLKKIASTRTPCRSTYSASSLVRIYLGRNGLRGRWKMAFVSKIQQLGWSLESDRCGRRTLLGRCQEHWRTNLIREMIEI